MENTVRTTFKKFLDTKLPSKSKLLDVVCHNAILKEAKLRKIKIKLGDSNFVELQRDLYLELMGFISRATPEEIENLKTMVKSEIYPWGIGYDDWRKEIAFSQRPQDLNVVEGIFQCRKCKSKRVISAQVQTRSADEGSTNIMRCAECGFGWKEYN